MRLLTWALLLCCSGARGLFFNTGRRQKAGLPVRMGLLLDSKGDIECDLASGRVPNIHGLFVAGPQCRVWHPKCPYVQHGGMDGPAIGCLLQGTLASSLANKTCSSPAPNCPAAPILHCYTAVAHCWQLSCYHSAPCREQRQGPAAAHHDCRLPGRHRRRQGQQ